MTSGNEFFLRYKGAAVDDGSIRVEDLMHGLEGLVQIVAIIAKNHSPNKKDDISLRLKAFDEGSFETSLQFIEQHPVLINNVTVIFVAAIGALAYCISNNSENKYIKDENVKVLVEKTINDSSQMKRVVSGFNKMAIPFNDPDLASVCIGLKGDKGEELINQTNKEAFIVEEIYEEYHKTICLKGTIRSLDKKTLNGKFQEKENGTIHSIKLTMDNPEDSFSFFPEDNVEISGVATIRNIDKKITKIEVEKITNE